MNLWLWHLTLPRNYERLHLTIRDLRAMSFADVFDCHVMLELLDDVTPPAPTKGR